MGSMVRLRTVIGTTCTTMVKGGPTMRAHNRGRSGARGPDPAVESTIYELSTLGVRGGAGGEGAGHGTARRCESGRGLARGR
jgi:hypothetical protein